ncbi:MAG: hypothetical protein AAGI15_01335 [Pseudomonadota bacterium]
MSRQLVALLDGELTCDSTPGQGSRFVVRSQGRARCHRSAGWSSRPPG